MTAEQSHLLSVDVEHATDTPKRLMPTSST
jgi:hypothetical protein